MKWNCTTSLLSIPVAAAVMGLGINTITSGQDRSTSAVQSETQHDTSAVAPGAPGAAGSGVIALEGEYVRGRGGGFAPLSDPGDLVFDGGDPIGALAMSNVHTDDGEIDRRIADDFELTAATDINGVEMAGLFFNGFAGVPPATETVRVTFYADASGEPGSPVCAEQELAAAVTDTGDTFADRIVWSFVAKLDETCSLDGGTRYWVSIQPSNSTDTFFHIESFQPPAFGEEVHVDYPDLGAPAWTPGSAQWDDGLERDKNFKLYAGDPPPPQEGACCLKVNGEDDCIDGLFADECDDEGGIAFHAGLTCDEATCPEQVECPDVDLCPWDLTGNDNVGIGDLLALLEQWGPCPDPGDCPADFDGSGSVGVTDLLILLENWGPCPTGSGGTFIEDEACGERVNDGCNMDDPAFDQIKCGHTVCGTAWTDTEFAEPPDGHLPGTCEGFCGGQSDDGCWCDDECFGFGDCCEDICEHCEPPDVPECVEGEVNVRDTDWFEFDLDTKQSVTWQVHAEFPATALILWVPDDCDIDNVQILAEATGDPKVPFEVSTCLQPSESLPSGHYALFVAPSVFEGLPCDDEAEWGSDYTATLLCEDDEACADQKGACCVIEECLEGVNELICDLEGGNYLGDGTDCEGDPCVLPVGACCFHDGSCVETNGMECTNDLFGAWRGDGTTCGDVDICRDCGEGGIIWEDPEPCDEDPDDPYNGGCNPAEDPAFTFQQLCPGDTVLGEIWAVDGTRDLDWRVLEIDEDEFPDGAVVNIEMTHDFGGAGFEGIVFLANAGCPSSIVASEASVGTVNLFRLVDPGTYYVIASADTFEDLPCDSGNNGYELTVLTQPQNPTACDGNCGSAFVPHPGFPGGFCSCDADNCEPGVDCCPGVCDFCDGDVCAIFCTYKYDQNNLVTGIGLNNPDAAIMWLHRFDAGAGDEITGIRTSYFATAGLEAGNPVGFAIYNAAPDGSPEMPALHSGTGTIEGDAIGSGIEINRQLFEFSPVQVSGEFFIAVWAQGAFPAPSDDTGFNFAVADNIWIAAETAGFPVVDPDNLPGMSLPPTILTDANDELEYVWLLCAEGVEE